MLRAIRPQPPANWGSGDWGVEKSANFESEKSLDSPRRLLGRVATFSRPLTFSFITSLGLAPFVRAEGYGAGTPLNGTAGWPCRLVEREQDGKRNHRMLLRRILIWIRVAPREQQSEGSPVERHYSTGISTLVALMAAHREAANSSDTNPAKLTQASLLEANRHLAGIAPASAVGRSSANPSGEHANGRA